MAAILDNWEHYLTSIDQTSPVRLSGRVRSVVGLIVRATLPDAWIGELCLLCSPRARTPVKAEVVGFEQEDVLLMPLGDLKNIGPHSEVVPTGKPLTVGVGWELLGRTLNGLGEPMDTEQFGPLNCRQQYEIYRTPPDPLKRARILSPLPVGVQAIDGLMTCGAGQRIGLFAAAGVGKSRLLGMIARNTAADLNVIVLVGERGREVRDFIEQDLGAEGLQRSVIVCATSDKPSLVRLKAAYVGTTIAEYFRDQGLKVMLLMDSVTRFARAQREVGLACGEPPARAGYTPSVFAELPRLLERTGNSDQGSITAFYTVLVAGDDLNEPVADEVRSILDGHIVLSRKLGARSHWPAIDVPDSLSRVMSAVTTPEHREAAGNVRRMMEHYQKYEDAIALGIYKEGKDPQLDLAIAQTAAINCFLRQGEHEKAGFDDTLKRLGELGLNAKVRALFGSQNAGEGT